MTDDLADDPTWGRVIELANGDDDILDLVLRGHLHVEQLLLAMLEHWAVTPKFVTEARLSFYQKLSLARSLNLHHPDEPIWHALAALNALRNDFAHRLTSEQRERKIRAFIEATESDFPGPSAKSEYEPKNTREELLGCFSYLLSGLDEMGKEYALRASIAKLAGKRFGPQPHDSEA